MENSQNFVSISYSNIDLLFQNDAVETVFSCTLDDVYRDNENTLKINFLSQQLCCINLDEYARSINQTVGETDTKKCIILRSQKILKGQNSVALITGADCRVKQIKYKDFSFFSEFYGKALGKKGILACSFSQDGYVCYLLDIEMFLKSLEHKK